MARIVECGSCGTPLEVPDGSEGKKFRCANCKEILVVPPLEEETAPDPPGEKARSEPRGGPIPQPRPRTKGKGTTRRFKGETRRRVREKEGSGDEGSNKRKKSGTRSTPPSKGGIPLALIAGAGAAVLVVIVIVVAVVFLIFPCGDGETKPATAGKAESAGADRTPEAGSPAPDPEAGKTRKVAAYRAQLLEARTAKDWFEAGEQARKLGFLLNARLHFFHAVQIDPEMENAWEALGYRLYRIPDDCRHMLEAPGVLDTLKPFDGRWLEPRKYDEIIEAEPAFLETAQKRFTEQKSNVHFAEIEEVRKRIHTQKGFSDRIWGDRPVWPYVVFDERGKKGEKLLSPEDSEFLVDKKLNMLKKVFAFVVDRWMKPLGYTRDESRPLIAVIFQNRASFADFNRAIGTYLPPGAIAYFSRMSKFTHMYDAPAVMDAEAQNHLDGILYHEATHQIVDAYLASGTGMERVSYWFNEGIAEYVGSVNRRYGEGDELHWDFGAENPGRIQEYWRARHPELDARTRNMGIVSPYAFTVSEIIKHCRNRWGTQRTLRKKILPHAWSSFEGGGMAGSLIYAQSYFLLYFCYSGGKPEYGEAMDRFLDLEFKGKGTPANFMKTFGLTNDEDLARFEGEMLAFHDSLVPDSLKRKR